MRQDVRAAMDWLYKVAALNGLSPQITSTDRSRAQQQALYNAWLARGKTGLPAAPPGQSKHEVGLAFDMTVRSRAEALGALWEQIGGRWGGNFNNPDPVHFEAS